MSPEKDRGIIRRGLSRLGRRRSEVWIIRSPEAFAEPTTPEAAKAYSEFLEGARQAARRKRGTGSGSKIAPS